MYNHFNAYIPKLSNFPSPARFTPFDIRSAIKDSLWFLCKTAITFINISMNLHICPKLPNAAIKKWKHIVHWSSWRTGNAHVLEQGKNLDRQSQITRYNTFTIKYNMTIESNEIDQLCVDIEQKPEYKYEIWPYAFFILYKHILHNKV